MKRERESMYLIQQRLTHVCLVQSVGETNGVKIVIDPTPIPLGFSWVNGAWEISTDMRSRDLIHDPEPTPEVSYTPYRVR